MCVRAHTHICTHTHTHKGIPANESRLAGAVNTHTQPLTHACRVYDRAAILLRGPSADLNFSLADYTHDPYIPLLRGLDKAGIVAALRRMKDYLGNEVSGRTAENEGLSRQ